MHWNILDRIGSSIGSSSDRGYWDRLLDRYRIVLPFAEDLGSWALRTSTTSQTSVCTTIAEKLHIIALLIHHFCDLSTTLALHRSLRD